MGGYPGWHTFLVLSIIKPTMPADCMDGCGTHLGDADPLPRMGAVRPLGLGILILGRISDLLARAIAEGPPFCCVFEIVFAEEGPSVDFR